VGFLVGLLDEEGTPDITAEDLDGPHGGALRAWQAMGLVDREPGWNPAAGCPHCGEGVPYRVGGRYVCDRCRSTVARRYLLLWRLDRDAVMRWVASGLGLHGGVRRIDESLWQLGTWEAGDVVRECFFRRPVPVTAAGLGRLGAFRDVVVIFGLGRPDDSRSTGATHVSLQEILDMRGTHPVIDRERFLPDRSEVRFDVESGVVTVGGAWAGELPVGSKEFYFIACLARHLDRFVPYADLKHYVLSNSGSKDGTEEATFCQRIKNRIKAREWVPGIDRLIVTTNKGHGYRLRKLAGGPREP
jgi:hypothetical protein